jgi:uncharacterized protein involved in response to NO
MGLALGLPWVAMVAPPLVSASWAGVLGLVQLPRQMRWRATWARCEPLLWSLHLGMAFLALGLILWGAAAWGFVTETGAIHVLGIGAVGGMTLAVMSRAALGHTGRPFVAPPMFAAVYWLMAIATVLRWLGQSHPVALVAAGVTWSVALVLFAVAIWPIVSAPRLERTP